MKVKEMVNNLSRKGSEAKMGRNLSPILRRELANLDKDADSRKLAMKALKSYVKDLDSNAIPIFLAQVSETKETGSLSGEYTISLYEVLARVHGVNIVPQIDSIMTTIIKTLASSAGSFPLQQACSKVVPAISRYAIDPTTPDEKKRHIIHSLCKPLSDSLLSSQESLTSGAALCLKALVDSDNWRFASDEMVNKVCQNVAAALEEKSTQINSHMGLVMSLAKHNALIVEAYARLLIQSGMRILNSGVVEGNSQKRLSAIQMVNFLMRSLDPRSIYSELELIIEEMEKCHTDHMAFVKGAAFEALQTARRIAADRDSKYEKGSSSVTGSNFSRREHSSSRNTWNDSDRSPASMSPESQTLGSFIEYDSFLESPISTNQASCNLDYGARSVNRKLWSYENGGVDVSLKDGLFSEVSRGLANTYPEHNGHHEGAERREDCTGEFVGFLQKTPRNGSLRSATPSPQRSRSHINADNINIFTTPRKLIHSLQDPSDVESDFSHQTRRFRSPCSRKFEWTADTRYDRNGFTYDVNYQGKENGNSSVSGEKSQGGSESVSSTEDIPVDSDVQVSPEKVPEHKIVAHTQLSVARRPRKITASKLILGLFCILLAAFLSHLGIDSQDEVHLVPT